jgi:hypothetical protein
MENRSGGLGLIKLRMIIMHHFTCYKCIGRFLVPLWVIAVKLIRHVPNMAPRGC